VLTQSGLLKQTEAVSSWQQGVVLIETLDSRGTGFNITPDGLVVTNDHVVDGVEQVWVKFSQGQIYRGTVQARHPKADLALVRITGQKLPWLPLASTARMAVDSQLLIIGNPLGFPFVTTPGVAAGQTVLKGWTDPVLRVRTYVQHGSSGSPVLNAQGDVVGIVFAMDEGDRDEESGSTTAYAVTVDSLHRFLSSSGLEDE
jgi:S1-C subfamily serine protease